MTPFTKSVSRAGRISRKNKEGPITVIASEQYFTEVRGAFERAAAATSDIRRYFRIGPQSLCLRFAGEALVKGLTRAFAHVEIPACPDPSLTILCWDSFSTQTRNPMPASFTASGAKGHILEHNNGVIRTVYRPGIDIFNMYHVAQCTGIYWMQDPGILPYWETSFPMRGLFHWWSRDLPFQLVHAGAVGTPQGGVLLTGKSGSGKSTTASACLNSHLHYAGDDYVMIACDPDPYVYSLYSTGKLNPESVGMLPHLEGCVSNPGAVGDEKALMFLHEHFPQQLSAGFPIRAVFIPWVTQARDTRLRPATAFDAMFALAPTTIKHLEGDSQLAYAKMRALVQAVPSYWLELGTDLAQVPGVIERFLEGARG